MSKIFTLSVLTLFAVAAFAASASAQFTLPGEVIDVIDGKTVMLSLPSGKVKVELQFIDVPEPGQQLHDTVKEHLRVLVLGKAVEYKPRSISKDRAIGRLISKNVDISQQMLRDGAAWHIPAEASGQDRSEFDAYASTEAAAKSEKIGIWAFPNLKPAWEVRAENLEIARQKERDSWYPNGPPEGRASDIAGRKVSSNPAFGNVGALLNRYDPESRAGLLSTSLIPGTNENPEMYRHSIDFTYYYKENRKGERTGVFVFTAVFESKTAQFLRNNDLVILDNGKVTKIGKPKRKASNQGYEVREVLMYKVPRHILERAANNEGVYFKIGDGAIWLTGARYLLYNMMQVTQ